MELDCNRPVDIGPCLSGNIKWRCQVEFQLEAEGIRFALPGGVDNEFKNYRNKSS